MDYTKEERKTWTDWYNSRPQHIKDLVDKYPPGWYVVKVGAPYGVTCEGTKVWLVCYTDNGKVGVGVHAEDKQPEAIEHERRLGLEHGKTEEEIREIHGHNIKTHVDPFWLEPLKVSTIGEST